MKGIDKIMKKKYESPEMDITKFEKEDCITTSGTGEANEQPFGGLEGPGVMP